MQVQKSTYMNSYCVIYSLVTQPGLTTVLSNDKIYSYSNTRN